MSETPEQPPDPKPGDVVAEMSIYAEAEVIHPDGTKD